MIYLDNNATTRPSDAVRQAVCETLATAWANPSSVHRAGQAAGYALEQARVALAELLNVKPREIVITSSGTESINLAIRGIVDAIWLARVRSGNTTQPLPNVVISPIEHAAVGKVCRQLSQLGRLELRTMPMGQGGVVDVAGLDGLIDEHTALVSLQWINNETGIVQPVEAAYERCRFHRVPMHTDAVQRVGKMILPASLPCDLLTFSAHKFHGPKGVGGLWIRPGVGCLAQMPGTQEMERRGGTQAVASIVGAGVAAGEAKAWLDDDNAWKSMQQLRDGFEEQLIEQLPGVVIHGKESERIWNTSNIGFAGLEAEALLLVLSEQGVCVSAGSACSSGSLEPSPVLLAMGVEERIAHGSIRVSLSRETTKEELDAAVEAIVVAVRRMG